MTDKTRCILFDWGDTLMRVLPDTSGPMYTWPTVEAVPGIHDALRAQQADWLLAMATNAVDSAEADIWRALERVKLDTLIEKVYCYRVIGQRKPSAEYFAYILDDLDLDRSQVVMVGDSFEADVMGAVGSDIRAVWFNAQTEEMRSGDMFRTIHALSDLPAALDALFG